MRALEFITGHVIYNPAYTYKFQLKTTVLFLASYNVILQELPTIPIWTWNPLQFPYEHWTHYNVHNY